MLIFMLKLTFSFILKKIMHFFLVIEIVHSWLQYLTNLYGKKPLWTCFNLIAEFSVTLTSILELKLFFQYLRLCKFCDTFHSYETSAYGEGRLIPVKLNKWVSGDVLESPQNSDCGQVLWKEITTRNFSQKSLSSLILC